jgi:hypothetical protein
LYILTSKGTIRIKSYVTTQNREPRKKREKEEGKEKGKKKGRRLKEQREKYFSRCCHLNKSPPGFSSQCNRIKKWSF